MRSPRSRRGIARAIGAATWLIAAALAAPGTARADEGHAGSIAQAAADGEISLNLSGRPFRGQPRYGEARGLLDGHSHMMIDLGFGENAACGRAWSPQGPAEALRDCPNHEIADGAGAYTFNVFQTGVTGTPTVTHDTDGWPSFAGWPAWNVVLHQQIYYRWLERAWRAGLRIYVMDAVDLAAACDINAYRTESCDETESVLRQIRNTYALQDYIDQRAGGPGRGWFRIVRNPFRARRVINQGKLAVVLGIETSELFGCSQRNGVPQCDRDDIDRGLDRMKRLGVTSSFVCHKLDNALCGVAMDKEVAGVAINALQYERTGRFWDIETCTGRAHDEFQVSLATNPFGELATGGAQAILPPGELPVYPAQPHCNKLGLTALGEHFVRGMIRRGMIVEVDHMSVRARRQTLNLLKAKRYGGVISSHSWSDPPSQPRILRLGGVITPMAGPATTPETDEVAPPASCCFLDVWQRLRETTKAGEGTFPIGFADDMSGPSPQPTPRVAGMPEVTYPFRSFDGGTLIRRQRSGTKTYDINSDGVAHFGLFPDWWERLRLTAGRRVTRDLAAGPEAYLEMWERAVGIRGPRARRAHGHVGTRGVRRLRLGLSPRQLLRHAGQPQLRTRAWRYRVGGRAAAAGPSQLAAVFTREREVGLVATTARGYLAAGIRPGARVGRLQGPARTLGDGLWVRRSGREGTRFVYGAHRGRVRFVGVGTAAITRRGETLARYLRIARVR